MLKNAVGLFWCILVFAAMTLGVQAAESRSLKLNQGAVGLLASQPELIDDALLIADALDHNQGLRILPVVGRGGLQSINDLLFLRGVDVAMIASDSLAYVKKHKLYSTEADKISYLAKLANVNVIILARKDFANLESLAGKRVATGPVDSDEFVAADLIFGNFDVAFDRVSTSGKKAITQLEEGRLDAAIFAGADNYPMLASIKNSAEFHILQISVAEDLADAFSPAILSAADLPNLIPEGEVVETVASALVLAVFDWPNRSERFYKLNKFNTALFENYLNMLSEGQRTNFLAAVPGWKPYLTAKEKNEAETAEPQTEILTKLQ